MNIDEIELAKTRDIKVLFRVQNYGMKMNDSMFAMVGRRDLEDLLRGTFEGDTLMLNYPEQFIDMRLQWKVMPLIYELNIKRVIVKTESPMIIGSTLNTHLYGVTAETSEDTFLEFGLAEGIELTTYDKCMEQLQPDKFDLEFIQPYIDN